jgi:hypothetical protein
VLRFDRDGQVIPFDQWRRLHSSADYRQVAYLPVRDAVVSTVWHGVDLEPHLEGDHIFETAVAYAGKLLTVRRWTSEEAAIAGHTRLVDWLAFQPDSA